MLLMCKACALGVDFFVIRDITYRLTNVLENN